MPRASIGALRRTSLICLATLLQACAAPDFDARAFAERRSQIVGRIVDRLDCPIGTAPVSYPAKHANWPPRMANTLPPGAFMLGCLETIDRDAVRTGPNREVLLVKDGHRLLILGPYPPQRLARPKTTP